jgi:hypothetical protein
LASPDDIWPWEQAPAATQTHYLVQSRSVVVLAMRLPGVTSTESESAVA